MEDPLLLTHCGIPNSYHPLQPTKLPLDAQRDTTVPYGIGFRMFTQKGQNDLLDVRLDMLGPC